MPEFPLGELAAGAADRFAPDLGAHLGGLNATAAVTADLTYTPDAEQKWRHDVRVDLKDARFTHPKLPWPSRRLPPRSALSTAGSRWTTRPLDRTAPRSNSRWKTQRSGECRAGSRQAARGAHPRSKPDDARSSGSKTISSGSNLRDRGDARRRPVQASAGQSAGSPADVLSGRAGRSRLQVLARGERGWKREIEVRPRQITMTYEKFKYPVSDVRGWVRRTTTHAGGP